MNSTDPPDEETGPKMATAAPTPTPAKMLTTSILPVDARKIGTVRAVPAADPDDLLDELEITLDPDSADARHLRRAADQLRTSDVPVAFPTETVYGLGADASRPAAVRAIFAAKRRPADNPLIVHVASLAQLRGLLSGPIPAVYGPVISRFWPGPLTVILPHAQGRGGLAPEVTAGLATFGARMPRHVLALALIRLAGVPVAAPSANASTRPSPTAAEHVAFDLAGRVETIIDGGPCDVGVESTVVDGLCDPPVILRPGGVSIEQLRSCPGWERTRIGYENVAESGASRPKAPGMKYRHYSPKAPVMLYEPGGTAPTFAELRRGFGTKWRVGVVTTKRWAIDPTAAPEVIRFRGERHTNGVAKTVSTTDGGGGGFAGMLKTMRTTLDTKAALRAHEVAHDGFALQLLELALGQDTADIARGIFSALRELDREDVDAIFVEGIDDDEGDTAAAVMNRLRKAAEVRVGE